MAPRRDSQNARETRGSSADETTAIISSSAKPSNNVADYGASGPSVDSAERRRGAEADAIAVRPRKSRTTRVNEPGSIRENVSDGWLSKMAEKYGSIELENKGSVARDHLALERTFLAWLRTSLSFASIGIAITQLFRLNTSIANPSPSGPAEHLRHVGKPLGATFIALSIVILFIGFHRYFESQHYVIRGKFPAGRGSIALVAVVAGALIMSSLVVVIVVAPTVFEKR